MIYDVLPVNNYTGNNSTTIFDFNFYIENENQLKVYLINSNDTINELVYGKDYSINEFGNENGSYITFPLKSSTYSVLSDNQNLSINLYLPILQQTQYENSSLLNLNSLEYSLDYLTRLIQILSRKIELCIKVTEGSNLTADELLLDIYNKAAQVAQNYNDSLISAEEIRKNIIISQNLITNLNNLISESMDNIKDEASKQVANVKSTGFYMQGSELYYKDNDGNSVEYNPIKKQITNCILEAPNGVASYNSSTITIKKGLKVLCANGRNDDGSLKNIEHTILDDISLDIPDVTIYNAYLAVDSSSRAGTLTLLFDNNIKKPTDGYWICNYNSNDNIFYGVGDDENIVPRTIIANFDIVNGVISNFNSFNPADILKQSDKSLISTWSMPSNRYIDYALGASGATYLMFFDGWVCLRFQTTSTFNYVHLLDNETLRGSSFFNTTANTGGLLMSVPFKKGTIFRLDYGNMEFSMLRLVMAEGQY